MRQLIPCMLLFVFMGQSVQGQIVWKVPQFQVLSTHDQIRRSKTPITPAERRFITQMVAADFARCRKNPEPVDPKTLTAFVNDLRVRKVDLGPQGQRGLVIQGSSLCECSADGNCQFWILEERDGRLKLLLDGGMEQFAVEPAQTGAYFDIVTGWHDSAFEQGLTRYRYSSHGYRPVGCALMSSAGVRGSHWTVFKTPHITPEPCE